MTLTPDTPSGVALITVDEAGNNAIVVAPGANAKLSPEDVYRAEAEIGPPGRWSRNWKCPWRRCNVPRSWPTRRACRSS